MHSIDVKRISLANQSDVHRTIFPDLTAALNLSHTNADLCWTPTPHRTLWLDSHEPHEVLWVSLQALSRTCRRLRAFALPMLWKVVQVCSIKSLGQVCESLRAMPHLAAHIRHFGFHWRLNLDADTYEQYSGDYGTVLDIAFSDRGAMWNRERRELDGEVLDTDELRPYFISDEGDYLSPGNLIRQRLFEEDGDSDLEFEGASGPDGEGPDSRIKGPNDFLECINEVIGRLTLQIHTVAWDSDVSPVPLEAFESLKRNALLRRLRFTLDYQREIHSFGKLSQGVSRSAHTDASFPQQCLSGKLLLSSKSFPSARWSSTASASRSLGERPRKSRSWRPISRKWRSFSFTYTSTHCTITSASLRGLLFVPSSRRSKADACDA